MLGYYFDIIDAEHAPYDRAAIDVACLATRAVNTAAIVRVQDENAAGIMSALDSGAAGVMVPHCDSPEKARAIAEHADTEAAGVDLRPRPAPAPGAASRARRTLPRRTRTRCAS